MAILKKGGSARLIVTGFKNLDKVTIPKGSLIQTITVEKQGTTAGNIKLGAYVPAVKEVVNIVVTGAPSANGNISVTLRGATAVLVPVLSTDNIAQTVTKIAAATYPGWTVAESLGTTVTWTAEEAGAKTGVTAVTGPAGFAKTGPTEVAAGADATTGEQTVATVALSGTDKNISNLTVVKKTYETDTDVYIGVSSAATGNIAIAIQQLF